MSILQHVVTQKCPHCVCSIVVSETIDVSHGRERAIREHVNGGRWETREFLCGYKVQSVPNFNNNEMTCGQCTSSPEYQAKARKVQEIREKISKLQNELTNLQL